MKRIIFIFCLLGIATANAQVNNEYAANIKKAESLYYKKDFENSAKTYGLAISLNAGKVTENDRYNAACSWALAGNLDSAFYYLDEVVNKNKYSNYNHIIGDTDLFILHDNKRWPPLLAKIKQNKDKAEEHYNKTVMAVLDTVNLFDQKYRQGIVEMIKQYGMQSEKVKERLKLMHDADSVNLVKIEKILDTYGWLGFDEVGRMGAVTIFLVIQHSPLKVQQKYLPMMRAAVAKKQAIPGNLALLEDRVALGEGRKQVYGSQVQTDTATRKNFLMPLEDPDNVDSRRSKVGLGPLAEYLEQFGIEWNLEEYKKQQAQDGKKKG